MLEKHLKIFDLDENFSLEELQEKYDSHLKEFDITDIDDELKNIYLEEQIRIRESHKVLLEYYYKNKNDNSSSSKSKINFIDVKQKINSFISTFFKKNVIAINIFIVVIVSGFIIWDKFKEEYKTSGPYELETLVFKDKQYFKFSTIYDTIFNNEEIKNSSKVFKCFTNGFIKINKQKIKIRQIKDYEIELDKNKIFEPIKDDTTLNNLISILIDNPSSSLVVDAIEKVKNYNLLTSKDGLQGKKYTWFWENSKLSMKAQ